MEGARSGIDAALSRGGSFGLSCLGWIERCFGWRGGVEGMFCLYPYTEESIQRREDR